MATTTATLTLTSADLTGDALSLSTTATLTKHNSDTGLDYTTGVNRITYGSTQSNIVLIESDDYTVVACNGGRLLSVASGAMRIPKENVYEAATSICYAEDFEAEIALTSDDTMVGKLIFSTEGRVSEKVGKEVSQKSIIFISSLIKNIDSMFKALTRRPYTRFFARSGDQGVSGMTLASTSGMTLFELHKLPA